MKKVLFINIALLFKFQFIVNVFWSIKRVGYLCVSQPLDLCLCHRQ